MGSTVCKINMESKCTESFTFGNAMEESYVRM